MSDQTITAPKPALVFLLAASCGLIVANIYYAQPLVGLIAPAIGIDAHTASLIVTLTQLGYATGLLFLVPLGDIIENRLLLTIMVVAAIPPLLVAATAQTGGLFLIAAGAIGLTSVAVQMLVPLAANLAPDHLRGRIVGTVVSGLLVGVLLARPVASLLADAFGWRAVFFMSAGMMFILACILRTTLPRLQPNSTHHYFLLLTSLLKLPFNTPVLRHRAVYQAASFGCFSLFWTAVPLLLAQNFGYSQVGIALFALVGAAGAAMAPVAGRLADRGHGRVGTIMALVSITLSFLLAAWGGLGAHSVIILAIACVLLDCGVQANLVFGQRAIFALAPSMRARLNGVFLAMLFLGGAAGSAITSPLLTHFGWGGICVAGFIAPLLALGYFALAER
ncbi:MAG: MFS transporter [Acidocella sp. 20-57-95]|nr:MAG: MFS transporter [Acidocella sp. 20-57-95]HQT63421.1 MFS transporter [Acidocella sp.]